VDCGTDFLLKEPHREEEIDGTRKDQGELAGETRVTQIIIQELRRNHWPEHDCDEWEAY
jgi:hypothetical protein